MDQKLLTSYCYFDRMSVIRSSFAWWLVLSLVVLFLLFLHCVCFLTFNRWSFRKQHFTCLQLLNHFCNIVCLVTGEETSGGFDSGHGSSLDRSYNPATALNRGQYYYNIPAPNRSGDYHHSGSGSSHHHTREPSGLLDLANREQRGSAFELYKKPSTSLHHYLDNNLRSVSMLNSL
jgi:hypothetical protein